MAAFGEADAAELDALIHPDIVNHALPTGADLRVGRENFKRLATMVRSAAPDQRFDVEDVIAQGDKVAIRCRWTGTHQGPFRGVGPDRQGPFSVEHIHIFAITDGLVRAHWAVRDDLGMLEQLGALAPGGALKADAADRGA